MSSRDQKRLLGILFTFLLAVAGLILQQAGLLEVDESAEVPTINTEQTLLLAEGTVTHVVDGDTLDVMLDGREQRIRLLGIDTPETVDPRKEVQCFGKEASQYLKDLVEGEVVRLEDDASQGDTDKYHRLLRYVYLDDINVNLALLANGYAYEYTYNEPYRLQQEFKAAQQLAQETGAGLWSDQTCDGQR